MTYLTLFSSYFQCLLKNEGKAIKTEKNKLFVNYVTRYALDSPEHPAHGTGCIMTDAVVAQLVCVSRVGSFGPGLFAIMGCKTLSYGPDVSEALSVSPGGGFWTFATILQLLADRT